jgi:hypothetical protein
VVNRSEALILKLMSMVCVRETQWLPEMFTVGMSGKGRRGDEQLPDVGYGRRNPNQARRKRK